MIVVTQFTIGFQYSGSHVSFHPLHHVLSRLLTSEKNHSIETFWYRTTPSQPWQ